MACVYILKSEVTGKKYVGSSRDNNPDTRLREHNFKGVRSTKSGCPWIVIHQEQISNYSEARKRENFLKSGQGRIWIKQNIFSGEMRERLKRHAWKACNPQGF